MPELSSNVLTIVTIFLPLSSIWAGKALDQTSSASESSHRLWNLLSFGDSQKSRQMSTSTASGAGIAANTCYSTPRSKPSADAEAETECGICVEREVSVQSYPKNSPHAV